MIKVLGYFIVIVLCPLPSVEHFIWPLYDCVLADICNHTWIPECGFENSSGEYRLFIDDCDLYEYNCDRYRDFDIVNYTECFTRPFTGCPTLPPKFYRMGNYKFVLEGRKIVYAPPERPTSATPFRFFMRTRPMLPEHMLKGKRRYTPEVAGKRRKRLLARAQTAVTPHSRMKKTTKPRRKITTKRPTVVIKTQTFYKNGKKGVRIFKGFISPKVFSTVPIGKKTVSIKDDSDFLE